MELFLGILLLVSTSTVVKTLKKYQPDWDDDDLHNSDSTTRIGLWESSGFGSEDSGHPIPRAIIKSPCNEIPDINKDNVFLNGAQRGIFHNYFQTCSCVAQKLSGYSIIINCSAGSQEAQQLNISPLNKVVDEVSTDSDQKLLTNSSASTSNIKKRPISTSTETFPLKKCSNDPGNSNFPFWFVIFIQLLVNVALVAYILRRRFFGPCRTLLPTRVLQIFTETAEPLQYQEFNMPVEDLPPTPRASFQYPLPTPEVVYEVNTNYGEAPPVERFKFAVYEDQQFDKNNPSTFQHNVYARTLDQQEDCEDHSTIKS